MFSTDEIDQLLEVLQDLRADIVAATPDSDVRLHHVDRSYRDSAPNLLHYLALRRHDLRPLQLQLAALGLSSLGRAEPHVLSAVDAVIALLSHLAGRPCEDGSADVLQLGDGQRLLDEHTEALLGPADPDRRVRIMVTIPSEAADDYALVQDLLIAGMDCMRINCAHDDSAAWLRMIEHVRRAEQVVGRKCRIAMDLSGPKIRTGPIRPGAAVVKVRPTRDDFGQLTAPARVWLTDAAEPSAPYTQADALLPMPTSWLAQLEVGDEIALTDARGAQRSMHVVECAERGCWAEVTKTTYIVPGTVLQRVQSGKSSRASAAVGDLPGREQVLQLQPGDLLHVTRDCVAGHPATFDSAGNLLTPATIGCTIPEIVDHVQVGEVIWFDDGKIGGTIELVDATGMLVRITQTRPGGAKLRADKGINLPDSNLRLPAVTQRDEEHLQFIARHADIVGLSFANEASDVEALETQLAALGRRDIGVVLKIETRRGFENLPAMLLRAMQWPCCGIMIARGDLAVECGFERLAEVQEEILWICEAAHIPVIWATQVLETLAKKGMPSRAEISDAAMGHRAECVMLNKGPHIIPAVRVLDGILRRMQAHQIKKRAMLRELHLAGALAAH